MAWLNNLGMVTRPHFGIGEAASTFPYRVSTGQVPDRQIPDIETLSAQCRHCRIVYLFASLGLALLLESVAASVVVPQSEGLALGSAFRRGRVG